jgi:hypothetical protein
VQIVAGFKGHCEYHIYHGTRATVPIHPRSLSSPKLVLKLVFKLVLKLVLKLVPEVVLELGIEIHTCGSFGAERRAFGVDGFRSAACEIAVRPS